MCMSHMICPCQIQNVASVCVCVCVHVLLAVYQYQEMMRTL